MKTRFTCPSCHKTLSADGQAAGKPATCPGCQTRFRIPAGPDDPVTVDSTDQPHNPPADSDETYGVAAAPEVVPHVRICPACQAETISETTACWRCGHDFASGMPGRPGPPDTRSPARRRRDAILLGVGFVALLGGVGVVAHLRSDGVFGGGAPESASSDGGDSDDATPRQPYTDRSWLQRTLIGEDYAPRDGNRTFGDVVVEHSGTSANLPFKMSTTALNSPGASVEMKGGRITGGWITAPRSELKASLFQKKGVEEFKIPDRMRLIQVRYKPKAMGSIVGQVLNYVGQINQYWAVDEAGGRYPLTGYWAIASRKDDGYLELFYNGDPAEPIDPGFECMLDFKVLKRPDINDRNNTVVYLLFLVPENAVIKRIENQVGDGDDVDFGPPQ